MVRALSAVAALMLMAGPVLVTSPALAQPLPPLSAGPTPPTGPPPGAGANPDPWERANRKFYGIHQSLDRAVLRPLAMGYKAVTPGPIGKGVHNVLVNLTEPVVFMNDMAQFRFRHAAETFTRFVGNTAFGGLGLFDLAGSTGLPHRDNDFGATLGVWGVRPGPYVFLPLIGPSTARDLFGKVVDSNIDPFNRFEYDHRSTVRLTRTVVGGLDIRVQFDEQLQSLDKLSTDSYATMRSFYLQSRQALIAGGETNLENLPDFDDAPSPPAADLGEPAPESSPAAAAAPATGSEGPPVAPADAPRP